MIRRVIGLVDELRGVRPSSSLTPQQEDAHGIVLAFLGVPCEFGRGCSYSDLGWRCGHRRVW